MVDCSVPSICELLLPVTRLMMFCTVGCPEKLAVLPAGMPKSLKLWKRLLPASVPPVMAKFPPGRATSVPAVPSAVICASADWLRQTAMTQRARKLGDHRGIAGDCPIKLGAAGMHVVIVPGHVRRPEAPPAADEVAIVPGVRLDDHLVAGIHAKD